MSGFGTTPVGTATLATNQFPIAMVAVPNTPSGNLTALEGGPASTDTNGNQTAPVSVYVKDGGNVTQGKTTDAANASTVIGQLKQIQTNTASVTVGALPALAAGTNLIGGVNLSQVLGVSLSATNPVIVQPSIQQMILNGQGYTATTGILGATTNNIPLCVFNPTANTKNILIYSIVLMMGSAGGGNIQCNSVTTDPAYGTNPTILNTQLGGAASSLSTSVSTETTNATLGGSSTMLLVSRIVPNGTLELLGNGKFFLLPKASSGSGIGLTTFVTPSSSTACGITVSWVEY